MCILTRDGKIAGHRPTIQVVTHLLKSFLREPTMLQWAITFLIIALIAGALGMFGLEGTAMEIARILFFVFLVMFVVSLVMGRRVRG